MSSQVLTLCRGIGVQSRPGQVCRLFGVTCLSGAVKHRRVEIVPVLTAVRRQFTTCSISATRYSSRFKTGSALTRLAGSSFGVTSVLRFVSSFGPMHSEKLVEEYPNLKVIAIPALSDNFMYLVIDKTSLQAVAFDPVEPDRILDEVRKENVTLTAVLTTHHHWDHADGNGKLVELYKKENPNATLEVYGGDDRIPALTNKIGQGDKIAVGSMLFFCHFTPCHTKGHICYYLETNDSNVQKPCVFTGDTLFQAGCGRFFEGTADQMYSALVEKLGSLPPETLVFCGHEYTCGNLKFALHVEPNNEASQQRLSWAQDRRSKKLATIPSTIAQEKEMNPFMRCVHEHMQKKVGATSSIDCMQKLRSMKDNFS